jgi:hypothetical protein
MTEKDLVDLGFEKVIGELDEPNWFYYTYDFAPGFSLISCASDEVENGEWSVEIFEADEFNTFSKIDVHQFIKAVEKLRKKVK